MIDAVVRVSFQSEPKGNQAANEALTGDAMGKGTTPFVKRGKNTALYHCQAGADQDVLAAVSTLMEKLKAFATKLDYVSITVIRTDADRPLEDQAN